MHGMDMVIWPKHFPQVPGCSGEPYDLPFRHYIYIYFFFYKVGPLPVISRVINSLIGAEIAPVSNLFSAIYRGYNPIYKLVGDHLVEDFPLLLGFRRRDVNCELLGFVVIFLRIRIPWDSSLWKTTIREKIFGSFFPSIEELQIQADWGL